METCSQLRKGFRRDLPPAETRAARWAVYLTLAIVLLSCHEPVADRRAAQCVSSYPHPAKEELAADTTTIPSLEALSIYHPSDSSPQIFSADSSTGRFRNLFHVRFATFRSKEEVRSFIRRFDAQIVGKGHLDEGWYVVRIPDPGPDSATFNLLLHCIGAFHYQHVRAVYSRQLIPVENDSAKELP